MVFCSKKYDQTLTPNEYITNCIECFVIPFLEGVFGEKKKQFQQNFIPETCLEVSQNWRENIQPKASFISNNLEGPRENIPKLIPQKAPY